MKDNENNSYRIENSYFTLYQSFKHWSIVKDKENRVKRLESKREKMIKQMTEIRKQENADKGFRTWLKMSLLKAKQEKQYKKQLKLQKKREKLLKQQNEEQKRIEAEINFK